LANSLTYTMRQLLLISLLLFPVITLAGGPGAWCLVHDEDEMCRYNTAEACYNDVAMRGGFCRENSRILGMSGKKRWCVVSASGRNCNFSGRGRCLDKARAINAGCVENTEEALAKKRRAEGWADSSEGGGASFAEELEAALKEGSASSSGVKDQIILEE
jgi:hypothetical protein